MFSKCTNEIATKLLHPHNINCSISPQFVVKTTTFAVINCSHYLQPVLHISDSNTSILDTISTLRIKQLYSWIQKLLFQIQ